MRSHPVNSPIAVRVEQSAGKVRGIPAYDDALPRSQLDRAQVLPAWPVLREQAWPVPGVARHLGTARSLLDADFVAGSDRAHGSLALPDEPRPGVRADDAQFPYFFLPSAASAYAAVSQIEAKQISVVSLRFGQRGTISASWTSGAWARASFRMLTPFPQRRSVDSGRHADAAETESAFYQSHRMTAYVDAVHNRIVADGTDKIRMRQSVSGAPGGTRTHTLRVLNPSSLPRIGVPGRSSSP
jgi:hypothetical protein